MLVVGSSAIELLMQLSLLSLQLEETCSCSMLVVETIDFGLKGLMVALVLLEFATNAIPFSSSSDFYGLKLVAHQLEVALFGAKNGVDAELFDANGVEARLSALRALGARGTSA